CLLRWSPVVLATAVLAGHAHAQQTRNPLTKAAALRTYDFQFDRAPWKDVVKWLVQTAELPFVGGSVPGTFTFTPPKVDGKDPAKYTILQIIDILNEALAEQ